MLQPDLYSPFNAVKSYKLLPLWL